MTRLRFYSRILVTAVTGYDLGLILIEALMLSSTAPPLHISGGIYRDIEGWSVKLSAECSVLCLPPVAQRYTM